jgi:hypothetical protein
LREPPVAEMVQARRAYSPPPHRPCPRPHTQMPMDHAGAWLDESKPHLPTKGTCTSCDMVVLQPQ